MSENDNVFKKISTDDERNKILSDLARYSVELICKGLDDNLYKIQVDRFEPKQLICRWKNSDAIPFFKDHLIIVTFNLGGDKFFFQAKCKVQSGEFIFDLPFDIFQLQRRQSYRLKLPSYYNALALIEQINHKVVALNSQLQDLSTGGCRFIVNIENAVFKIGDELKLQLQIKDRAPLFTHAEVRYVNGTVVGVEFTQTTPAFEARVFSITLDLHKEFFSHLN